MTGSDGMVLMGEWGAEEGHDAIAGELVDRPLVLVDLIHEDLEASVHDPVDLLGVELLGDGSEVCHVGKEDGDELALAFDGAPGGENLLGEELGGVGLWVGVIEESSGLGGSEGLAATTAELIIGEILETALRTRQDEFCAAGFTELPCLRILNATLRAFHLKSPSTKLPEDIATTTHGHAR